LFGKVAAAEAMKCGYCGFDNSEGEHRCGRCGRRLGGALPVTVRGSALPNLAQQGAPVIMLPKREPTPARPAQQPLPFTVIPFEAIGPYGPAKNQAGLRPVPRKAAAPKTVSGQGRLQFAEAPPLPAAPVAPACLGPVASLASRSRAAALDSAIVAGAFLLFVLISRIWAPGPALERMALWSYGLSLALIGVLYRLLVCLLSDRSPGLRIEGLRCLCLDGRPAGVGRRLKRDAAVLLSLMTGGFGFVWALFDADHFTFHDHISETFISPDPAGR